MNAAAAAAKSLQSCPTLCDPIDGSPPGSPVPGILQARTLEWVAMSFSNAWKWKVKVKSLSRVRLFMTLWTAAYQAPPSMGFSRQEYWSEVPLPSPIQWIVSYIFYNHLNLSLKRIYIINLKKKKTVQREIRFYNYCFRGIWSKIFSSPLPWDITLHPNWLLKVLLPNKCHCVLFRRKSGELNSPHLMALGEGNDKAVPLLRGKEIHLQRIWLATIKLPDGPWWKTAHVRD